MAGLRRDHLYLLAYLMILLMAALSLPRSASMYQEERAAIVSFGVIGIWRYCWWLNHVVRSLIYRYAIFPRRRLKANQLWASGWRPKRLFFM
ncbi:MAG TPA: hypothetical protein DDY37_04575, partial [Legionella sp.]|nr:hypothetical protein [Legionella sp.]